MTPHANSVMPNRDLASVLQRQRTAFRAEGPVTVETRIDRLDRLISLAAENATAIAETSRADYGGARSLHMIWLTELYSKVGVIEQAKAHVAEWMKPQVRNTQPPFNLPGTSAQVIYQPKGVVGILSPWNLPFGLTIAPLTCALAAGNRAMVKPSEYTPETSALLASLFTKYFAEDEVAVILGDAAVGAAFARLPFDHILFTGSTGVGRHIMRAAAENLVPVTLELGGKCPVVIGTSAAFPTTAASLGFCKMLNAGQLCLSPDYVLVPEAMEEMLVAGVVREVGAMYPDTTNNPDLTGIVNAAHFDRLVAHVEDARHKGAKITVVNPVVDQAGQNTRRMPLHILQNVTPEMSVMQEEIFGPLLPIIGYTSLDEALAVIAAQPTPLGLYIFSEDVAEQQYILEHTQSGGVTINDILQHYVQEDLPFGGIGASGMGAYHGRDGFLTFSHARAVFRQAQQTMAGMFRPPFTPELQNFLEGDLARRVKTPEAVD